MSKENNKHSDIERIKRAISKWQAKKEDERVRQRHKNLSVTGFYETNKERAERKEAERIAAKKDEYSELFDLIFESKIKSDEVNYHLFDLVDWNFKPEEKNGRYIALRPCPIVCTSREGRPKFLYNSKGVGTKASTDVVDNKQFEEYDCPYGVGYHLRTKDTSLRTQLPRHYT